MAIASFDTNPCPIGSRWQHVARGTYYTVINHGTLLVVALDGARYDNEHVTIYESETDHSVWVRPLDEFLDGRFTRVPLP